MSEYCVSDCLRLASELAGSDSARLDIELILCRIFNKNRAQLLARPETVLDGRQLAQFKMDFARRREGEPIAYILGTRDFWTLSLNVSSATLIPRPDTELLVEIALERSHAESRILDLGTGTGAIALALASELPGADIHAVDTVPEAVALAEGNRVKHALHNVRCYQSDWFAQIQGRFDLIVSNPPYIAAEDPHLDCGDVRFEPRTALVAEQGGLAAIAQICECAGNYLFDGAWLIIEHGWQQAEAVRRLLLKYGFFDVDTRRDYGGNERVSLGYWRPADSS